MTFDLDRFKRAQAGSPGFETALRELEAGRKRSHWIWYIFPQLAGLGGSPMAIEYGLHGGDEAAAYLRDPLLRDRLLAAATAVLTHLRRGPAPALGDVMGSEIDALKLVSSMTLFRDVARRMDGLEPKSGYAELAAAAEGVLVCAAPQGFAECGFTISLLRQERGA